VSWQLLLLYDEDRLSLPTGLNQRESMEFDLAVVRQAIACLRGELALKGEATDLFGRERGESLTGILGSIYQTFGRSGSLSQCRGESCTPALFRNQGSSLQ